MPYNAGEKGLHEVSNLCFLVPTETKPAGLVKKRVISESQEHFIVEQVI